MPIFKNDTLSANTLQGLTLLKNALETPEILKPLSGFNYPPEKLQGYLASYEQLDALIQKQKTEYSEQHEATRKFEEASSKSYEKYMFNLKLARVIFKKNGKAQEDLCLKGSRKLSFSGWFTDADTFYKSILATPEYLKEFNNYNITDKDLSIEQSELKESFNLNASYLKEKGEAVEATRLRDELIDNLEDSMQDLIKICKLLFAKRPEILKQLGIVA